jgi:EF hand
MQQGTKVMDDTNEMKPENEATPESVTTETATPVSTKRFSNKSMMALGFLALATVVGGTAIAKNRHGGDMGPGMMGGPAMNIDTMDADKSGDISFEEFSKAAGDRFILADTNKDGKVTVEEMAAAIEKMRAENMAP